MVERSHDGWWRHVDIDDSWQQWELRPPTGWRLLLNLLSLQGLLVLRVDWQLESLLYLRGYLLLLRLLDLPHELVHLLRKGKEGFLPCLGCPNGCWVVLVNVVTHLVIGVDSVDSNAWIVIVVPAVERVFWLGAATGSHVVDQTFELCSSTSIFVRWSSWLAVLDDELWFVLVQFAMLLERVA